jgi:CheY-like chemotaxis protein
MQDADLSPCRILVVDDCHDTTTSLSLLLTYWGHEARTAASGPEALVLAAEYHPDVVLLDISMPGMDGLELARRLRRELHLGVALLVSMSGFGQEQDRRQALDAGCDHHLVKPADLQELRHLLECWARSRHALTPSEVVGKFYECSLS